MPKLQYVAKSFTGASFERIRVCNEVIAAYEAQGYDLTLRQLYYQLVSRALIQNTEREYKNLGALISDARLAGLIDWDRITDRTRNLRKRSHWETPAEIIRSAAHSYSMDRWKGQKYAPEVWIEKDALIGVIEQVCSQNDVPYFACRGYTSQSEMWAAGMRLLDYKRDKRMPVVLHLGDHDPSGIDMSRDITDRLSLFTAGRIKLERLALNMDQVRQYNPPPNPAKVTDSRARGYIREFGRESWELDALEPAAIVALIQGAIDQLVSPALYQERVLQEESGRQHLTNAAENWEAVTEFLQEE